MVTKDDKRWVLLAFGVGLAAWLGADMGEKIAWWLAGMLWFLAWSAFAVGVLWFGFGRAARWSIIS